MTRPYALTVTASRKDGYDIAEALGFDDVTDALSVSVFDDGPDRVLVEALYALEGQALAAQSSVETAIASQVAQVPDEDWVGLSQAGLPPIEAGRFVVHGSHDSPGDAPFPILIDAGQAFGTGHHGTTKGCLLMLDALDRKGVRPKSILDLGTGAGLLAIAAAKLFPTATILATDIDPIAIDVTRTNAELNGVSFEAIVADGFQTPALEVRQFDLVIANILAGPLRGMAPDIAAATKSGGMVILSGILDEQAEWVSEAFQAEGLAVSPQPSLNGWTSLLAHKPGT